MFRAIVMIFILSIPFLGKTQEVLGGIQSQEELNNESIVLGNIIATYQGNNISKQSFLDFLEMKIGEKEKKFQSYEELENHVLLYVIYDFFNKEALRKGMNKTSVVQEELRILEKYIEAEFYQSLNNSVTLSDELNDFLNGEADFGDLSDVELSFIMEKEGVGVSLVNIREDGVLYQQLINAYKEILFYAKEFEQREIGSDNAYLKFYEYQVRDYLANVYVKNYLSTFVLNDDVLEENFKQWLKDQKFIEYKASHIYTHDLTLAEDVLKKLKEGSITFIDAVLAYSEDELSKKYEGKVGQGDWVTFPNEEHPFAKELKNMDVGEFSTQVVEGIDGFHIILLEEKREGEMPHYMESYDFKYYIWSSQKLNELYKNIENDLDIILF